MRIRVYVKCAVNMAAKTGVFTYYFVRDGEVHYNTTKFSTPVKTLAHADCAAYVNALNVLIKLEAINHCTELEIVTDSGVVKDLLEVYKFQKHCDIIAMYWREKVQPHLPLTLKMIVKKVVSKTIAGNADSTFLTKCYVTANGELRKINDLIN